MNIDTFKAMLRATPYFWPTAAVVCVVAVGVAALLWRGSRPLASRLAFFGVCAAPIIAATLTPNENWQLNRSCGIGASWSFWQPQLSTPEGLLNLALFVPFGLAGWLLFAVVRSAIRWVVLAATILASPIIEFVQWLLPSLGHTCQGADITANMLGALIGVFIAVGLAKLISPVTDRKPSLKL